MLDAELFYLLPFEKQEDYLNLLEMVNEEILPSHYLEEFIEKYKPLKDYEKFPDISKSNKVTCYTICKNEIKFIERWLNSVKQADYICVLDTGSTDGTYEFLQKQPNIILSQKIYDSFKFDRAFNDALALVPEDSYYNVILHADQYFLEENWVDILKNSNLPSNQIYRIGLFENDILTGYQSTINTSLKNIYWVNSVHEGQSHRTFKDQLLQTHEDIIDSIHIIHTPTSHRIYTEKDKRRYEETPYNFEAFLTYVHSLLLEKKLTEVSQFIFETSYTIPAYKDYWNLLKRLLGDKTNINIPLLISKYQYFQELHKGTDEYEYLSDNLKLLLELKLKDRNLLKIVKQLPSKLNNSYVLPLEKV